MSYRWSRGESNPRPVTENTEKYADSKSSAAPCAARDAQTPTNDPALANLTAAWPHLPDPIRQAILAMIEAAKGERT